MTTWMVIPFCISDYERNIGMKINRDRLSSNMHTPTSRWIHDPGAGIWSLTFPRCNKAKCDTRSMNRQQHSLHSVLEDVPHWGGVEDWRWTNHLLCEQVIGWGCSQECAQRWGPREYCALIIHERLLKVPIAIGCHQNHIVSCLLREYKAEACLWMLGPW